MEIVMESQQEWIITSNRAAKNRRNRKIEKRRIFSNEKRRFLKFIQNLKMTKSEKKVRNS